MAATLVRATQQSLNALNAAATLNGFPSPGELAVQITGTWTGTMTFEVTVDGANWASYELNPSTDMSGTTSSLAATTTGNGVWIGPSSGFSGFRVRFSTYSTGPAVVTVRYSAY